MANCEAMTVRVINEVPEVSPEDVLRQIACVTLIDVRRPDEFDGELSHISGAKLVTQGPELDSFLSLHDRNDLIVFVCRSGARSGKATLQARSMGFSKCVNLQGGMLLWNEKRLPVEEAARK